MLADKPLQKDAVYRPGDLKGYGTFFDELCLIMIGFCFGAQTSAGIKYGITGVTQHENV